MKKIVAAKVEAFIENIINSHDQELLTKRELYLQNLHADPIFSPYIFSEYERHIKAKNPLTNFNKSK